MEENPMESDGLVMTYTFRCSVTKVYFAITLRGRYLQMAHAAKELIAERLSKSPSFVEGREAVPARVWMNRLESMSSVEPGDVICIALNVRHNESVLSA